MVSMYQAADGNEVSLSGVDVLFSVAEDDPAPSSLGTACLLAMTAALLLTRLASVNVLACFRDLRSKDGELVRGMTGSMVVARAAAARTTALPCPDCPELA